MVIRLEYKLKNDNLGGGGPICPLNKHENLHFNNEENIHMSFENYEEKWLQPQFRFANHLVNQMVNKMATWKKQPFETHLL